MSLADLQTAPDSQRLENLVFEPLQTAVVATSEWRPGQPSIPASALPQLLAIVRDGIGDQFAIWNSSGVGRLPGAAPSLGAKLWPVASRLLRSAPCPPLWSAMSGLPAQEFDAIRTPVAQLLANAAPIEAVVVQCGPSRPAPDPRQIMTMLNDLARGGAPGFRLALVILLRRCPRQEGLAALALSTARNDDAIEEAAYSGATYVLDATVARHQGAAAAAPDGAVGQARLRAIAAEIADAARVTRCVEAMAALRPLSKLHREVGRKRVVLQTICLDRFEELVSVHLLRPLEEGQVGGPASLRGTASELGKVCGALRLLGDRHGTERAIRKAAGRLGAALGGSDSQAAIAADLVACLGGTARA